MQLLQCKSTCNLTDFINLKITSVYDLPYLRQYYINSTTSCNIYLCNLILQMYDKNIYDISNLNSSMPYSMYINPYAPSTSDLSKIYRLLMNSVSKTDNSSFIDYNQCVIIPKNNTVSFFFCEMFNFLFKNLIKRK
jgi:hypothetical protein